MSSIPHLLSTIYSVFGKECHTDTVSFFSDFVKRIPFDRIAPKCILILYGANAVGAILYLILATNATKSLAELSGGSIINPTQTIFSVIASVVMIICNYVYFKKRSHLFVN